MRIIEQHCQGKRTDQSLNEDGLIITDDFAAVVDGATSKSVRHLWQPSGGVMAKDLALEVIAGLPADADMRQTQQAIDGRFRQAHSEHGADTAVFTDEPVERLQANAVVYSADRHEACCSATARSWSMASRSRPSNMSMSCLASCARSLRWRCGARASTNRLPLPLQTRLAR